MLLFLERMGMYFGAEAYFEFNINFFDRLFVCQEQQSVYQISGSII